jgi:hypothetical protein
MNPLVNSLLTRFLVGALSIVVVGCSDPRDLQLAKMNKEQSADLEKKLNGEEMRLLLGYQMRLGLGQAFGGKGLPDGITVRQAINDQRAWLEKRKVEEAQAAELKKKIDAERQAKQEEFKKILSVVLVGKTNAEQDYGRKFIALEVAYENKTDKDILGVKGLLKINDMFGDKIQNVRWSYDQGIPARQTKIERGSGIDVNKFRDEDMKLWNTDITRLKALFEVRTIIFSDGTRADAPE